MEGLFFVLIIIFLIANANSKKIKAAQKAKAVKDFIQADPANQAQAKLQAAQARAAAKAAQPAPTPVSRLSAEERAERLGALKEKQRARRQRLAEVAEAFVGPGVHSEPHPAPAMAQGASLHDDEGCLGGSLPHDHSEGENRAEHAAHIAAMEARDAEEAAVAAPRGLAGFDPRDLRRAVVISEILGKPRAYRGIGNNRQ